MSIWDALFCGRAGDVSQQWASFWLHSFLHFQLPGVKAPAQEWGWTSHPNLWRWLGPLQDQDASCQKQLCARVVWGPC